VSGGIGRTEVDGVVELSLERPDSRNALTTEMLRALLGHLEQLQESPAVRAVILCGAGEVFCGGADTREFPASAPPNASLARVRLVAAVLRRLSELEPPTIAVVHGAAIGAGWGLALSCDLCFAAEGSRFALPEAVKGYRLPAAIPQRLTRILGPVRAAELVLTGAERNADRGVNEGWVNAVFPDRAAALAHAREVARAMAASPRTSMTAAKVALRGPGSEPFPPSNLVWQEE
jgi:enoyl-CoA hydratase/carnithine racemase